ncbi:hypothetical protein QJS04_geneDACA000022 [Acorus gramineus]|uniref:PPPDE domain-containing protein n=1 Tax=Acorus gramineus TaxID=55184 RepID=A0AAV9AP57_ACOGR|nr:hypothetical protein QJS04_geneDACA000022 [Acorus gramineus]
MAEEGHKVTLNVYDLSQGLARQISTTFLGKAIEAIWHTGIVVYGNEYYFGGGIQQAPVGTTPYGRPMKVVDLGITHVPKELFEEYLQEISPRYTAETYSLLHHNCNNFSNEVAQFLVGTTIPDYIIQLPNEVMSSPMGPLILPMIQQLETTMRAGAVPQAPQFRPPSMARPQTTNATGGSHPSPEPSKPSDSSVPMSSTKESKAGSGSLPAEKSDMRVNKKSKEVAGDPLGGVRKQLQEEITREFAAIMATGTLRASEAAALATRRVMQKHGRLDGVAG